MHTEAGRKVADIYLWKIWRKYEDKETNHAQFWELKPCQNSIQEQT